MPTTRPTRIAAAVLAGALLLTAPAALARRGGDDPPESEGPGHGTTTGPGTTTGGGGGQVPPARDGGEVEVAGSCGAGAQARLKLKQEDSGIVAEFEVEGPARATWRVALVHERRLVWQGRRATGRRGGSLSVERTVPVYAGANTVAVLAWGPRGLTCRATATLPG